MLRDGLLFYKSFRHPVLEGGSSQGFGPFRGEACIDADFERILPFGRVIRPINQERNGIRPGLGSDDQLADSIALNIDFPADDGGRRAVLVSGFRTEDIPPGLREAGPTSSQGLVGS